MPDRHDDCRPRRIALGRLGLTALAAAALWGSLPAAPAAASGKPVAVDVSFEGDASVRLRGGRFAGERVAAVNALLAAHPEVRAERLFDASEASLDRRRARVRGKGRRGVPDLNRHYRLVAPDAAERDALVAALQRLGVVDEAVAEPRPAPAPATPSFFARQRYAGAAPAGIDVSAFAGLPGGRGEEVKIVDVEYAWNRAHEELGKAAAAGALIPNGTPRDPFPEENGDHGTAVLGELIGADDGAGITGLAPASALGLVNAANAGACPIACWSLADAVTIAHRAMQPGDVMLLEQQFPARESRTAYGPVELWEPVYDAVRLATQDGIIVVEAAGNGGVDLDAPQYGTRFPDGKPDSGAIIVGAGSGDCSAPVNGRLSHSNYGSRVDLQGWGQCVTTSGYGGLFDGGSLNSRYTDSFGGTSSASPIVAAAAALYSSVYQATRGSAPSPQLVRSRLVATGSPQANEAAGHIGPLPNLRAAAADFDVPPPPRPRRRRTCSPTLVRGGHGGLDTPTDGTLERVAAGDAPDGGWVARAASATGAGYGLGDEAAPGAPGSVAGATYVAGCWVRAAAPQAAGRPVRIVVRERAAATGALVKETAATAALGTGFARLSVAAVAAGTGNRLGVRCEQTSAVAGRRLRGGPGHAGAGRDDRRQHAGGRRVDRRLRERQARLGAGPGRPARRRRPARLRRRPRRLVGQPAGHRRRLRGHRGGRPRRAGRRHAARDGERRAGGGLDDAELPGPGAAGCGHILDRAPRGREPRGAAVRGRRGERRAALQRRRLRGRRRDGLRHRLDGRQGALAPRGRRLDAVGGDAPAERRRHTSCQSSSAEVS